MEERKQWVDTTRGIGILLVLLIHAATGAIREHSAAARAVYEFGMYTGRQLLFFLAGVTFQITFEKNRARPLSIYIGKKAKKLLVPYLVYGIGIMLLFSLAFSLPFLSEMARKADYGSVPLLTAVLGILRGDVPYATHLWFLYDLFFFSCITFAVGKIWARGRWILAAAAVLLWKCLSWRDWGSWIAVTNMMYFYIWFVLGTIVPVEKMRKLPTLGISFAVTVFGWRQGWQVFINAPVEPSSWLLQFCKSFVMTGGLLLLLVTLGRMIHGRTASVLQALGKRSFDFYLFQQPFFGSVFGTVLFSILGVPALLSVLGSFLLSLGAGWMISRMLDRTKHLKKLFGR